MNYLPKIGIATGLVFALGFAMSAFPVGVSVSDSGINLVKSEAHARRGQVRFVFGKPGAPSKNRRLVVKLRKRAAKDAAKNAAKAAKAARRK